MYTRSLKEIGLADIQQFGEPYALLGDLSSRASLHMRVADGFVMTGHSYRDFAVHHHLDAKIKSILKQTNLKDKRELARASARIRGNILRFSLPTALQRSALAAYRHLAKRGGKTGVVICSGAPVLMGPAADGAVLPPDIFLSATGEAAFIRAIKRSFASLFSEYAMRSREVAGIEHTAIESLFAVLLIPPAQSMISGWAHTSVPAAQGISATFKVDVGKGWGGWKRADNALADTYLLFKAGPQKNAPAIIDRRYANAKINHLRALSDDCVINIARAGISWEQHYQRPLRLFWVGDRKTAQITILSVFFDGPVRINSYFSTEEYRLSSTPGRIVIGGQGIGAQIAQGTARILKTPAATNLFNPGDVLVARQTNSSWEPLMQKASAIIIEEGGENSHATRFCRHSGICGVVGAAKACRVIAPGRQVTVSTVDPAVGVVYKGRLPFEVERRVIAPRPLSTKIGLDLAEPDAAAAGGILPVDGSLIGLESIMASVLKVHPLALVNFKNIQDKRCQREIKEITGGARDMVQYGIDQLTTGIARVASAFFPRPVTIRLTDFAAASYDDLLAGTSIFEPKEASQFVGWRGAARYLNPAYQPALALECAAIKKAREEWGLTNIAIMVPSCRTAEEAKEVLRCLEQQGLRRGARHLRIEAALEMPASIMIADQMGSFFDGVYLDLSVITQLIRGVDRNSPGLRHLYDENSLLAKQCIRRVTMGAHRYGASVSATIKRPEDCPELIETLITERVDWVVAPPGQALATYERLAAIEHKVGRRAVLPLRFTERLAKSVLNIIGIVGIGFLLSGYTCAAVNNRQVETNMQTNLAAEVAGLRESLRQEIQQQLQARNNTETVYYEDGFAHFQMKLPADWHISHAADAVHFGPAGGFIFSISKFSIQNYPLKNFPNMVTGTFHSFSTKVFSLKQNLINPDQQQEKRVLLVYPDGYTRSEFLIEISGDPGIFDQQLEKIQEIHFDDSRDYLEKRDY